jgi:geranylgeranyl diphosphate synthase, type II
MSRGAGVDNGPRMSLARRRLVSQTATVIGEDDQVSNSESVINGHAGTNGRVTASPVRLLFDRRNAPGLELRDEGAAPLRGDAAAAPLSIRGLHEQAEDALTDVNFAAAHGADRLAEAARYALLAGGKRVRPILVMATAQALGLPTGDVMPTACAIEMIHTNSLIVDDLPAMDNHPKRRGRPSLHRAYGDDIAILAGCALLSEAQRLILEEQPGSAELRNAVLMNVLQATGINGMVSGQFLDVTRYRPSDPQDLERTQMLKTGALIVACVRCATVLAGRAGAPALTAFAQSLGTLFQVVDDILDETGKARWLGKIPRNDRSSGKMTNVTMYGLGYARATATGLYENCQSHLDEVDSCVPGSVEALREITDCVYQRNR